jgi:hypothetical protein
MVEMVHLIPAVAAAAAVLHQEDQEEMAVQVS